MRAKRDSLVAQADPLQEQRVCLRNQGISLRSHPPCPAVIPLVPDPAGRDLLCFAAHTFVEANYVTHNSTGNSRSSWRQVRLVQWTITCLVIGLTYKLALPAAR